ncbi:hypothetical protein J2857_003584 [Neorhizobium galegae]|nr:hypothetical protein [Neorhizobium galegae]MBP2560815.1 hypothetical protein [Neorhizobium galegae]
MAEIIFRVHFADGTKLDIPAANAKAAGEAGENRNPSKITKIKRVRG